MKNLSLVIILICLLTTAIFASVKYFQNNMNPKNTWLGYEKEWQKVDSLESAGLPKSALEIVEEILVFAEAEKNAPQTIKSLTYKSKYIIQLEEDGEKTVINLFEEKINATTFPTKNILQSMLGEMYWNYYSANRWKIQNRTQTVGFINNDVTTWDITSLHNRSQELYTASVKDREALKKVNIKDYNDILIPGDEFGKLMRPTLFDFLAHRAIEFLGNDEAYITDPTYNFEITEPVVFDNNKNFAGYVFSSKDTASKKLLALRLLQDLTTMHLYDPYPSALVDIDIKRLAFAKNYSIIPDKDSLYLKALISEEKMYSKDSSSARISYLIAQVHQSRASNYERLSGDEFKWELKKAVEICDAAIAKYPNSIGGKNCLALKETILQKGLDIAVEKINVPDLPFRSAVTFKNIETLYLRILKITSEQLAEVGQLDYEERITFLNKLPVQKQWEQKLPNDGDHNEHVTEIKIDALSLGSYVLLGSSNAGFDRSDNKIIAIELWVSNLSYITSNTNDSNNAKGFYITDRTSGKPIKGASIQTYRRDYDYNSRKYKFNADKTYTTDENGYFLVNDPLIKDYYYFSFSIRNGKDFLDIGNNFYIYKSSNSAKNPTYNTFFFTDRSIYRPGQTIYFKGILTENSFDGKKKNVIANKKTTVNFYDVNSQKIASVDLVSNEYGSFAGTFTAPLNVLTGDMRLQNENGTAYFSVEEYKRPTFSVSFDPVKGSFVLGDSIQVSGYAEAYAGANIDNAKVNYRVVRNASFPYWYDYGWWRKPYPNVPEMEITNGTTITDGEGKFKIDFIAIPDLNLNKIWRPQFSYTVYADITDISGETRSMETYVSVGYVSLSLYSDVPELIYTNKPANIIISTSNLNGTPEPASGKIKIYPLDAPDKLFRDRNWSQPDKQLFTQEEYYRLFPNDLYADENNKLSWKQLNLFAEVSWNTANSDSVLIDAANFTSGEYKMEIITSDKNGEEIKIIKYFSVLKQGEYSTYPQYQLSTTNDVRSKPGENAIINFGSSAKDVRALLEITKGNGETTRKWISLPEQMNKGNVASMMDIEIPIVESDRGGVGAQICFIKDGRFFTQNYYITVPWDNKNLKVELETHRDKLLPGTKETWKVKISGNNGEKVAAEFLASMYDASLDAFKGHYWQFVSWPYNYRYSSWNAEGSFGNGSQYYWADDAWWRNGSYHSISYDYLNWFGLNLGYNYYDRRNYNKGAVTDYYDGAMKADQLMAGSQAGNVSLPEAAVANEKEKKGGFDFEIAEYTPGHSKATRSGPETITPGFDQITARTNLNETAFFYPQLETDSAGNIIFSFTMPEALTKWNFMGLAHTKDLQSSQIFSNVVTQKELMVQPNAPRFLREGDELEFTTKISNLTDSILNGVAQLELFNALNMQPVDLAFANNVKEVKFTTNAKGSAVATWKLKIPSGFDAIVYRVKAKAGNFTDGEENALPVLTNRILVTEALPLWVRGNKTADFNFAKLINSANSNTIRNQSVTLEYTSNPAWYAVQALPYLMEYPYECAEQVFSRYYANSIAYYIANSDPEIKRVFESWKNNPESLTSNLEKNQELKSLLLEETPWVLQAQNETERKKRVALLFDINRMQNEMSAAINKLEKLQLPNGGWPWFKGYKDDRYITQYIVTGLAHLKQLGITDQQNENKINNMLDRAITYCDERTLEDYKNLELQKIDKTNYQPNNFTIQYLYARSYFKYAVSDELAEANKYYTGQLKKFWTNYALFEKGLIAMVLNRSAETPTALNITKSLKEFSLNTDEMGMYWKENAYGYFWYQAPIETQALMIEVFGEVAKDEKSVEDLKVWLLRQKQTTDWKTTKATAEACYALLLRGTDLLANKELAIITVGKLVVQPDKVEAGTGYFKTNWLGTDITPDLGKINIKPSSKNQLSYGAMYWQYFEDIDKITSSNNQLQLNKKLFLQENSATGPVLKPIDENVELHVGDLVKVRIEIRVDRDMEYVHMKDMRASCFEPVNVLSEYKWQDGLGYYEATGDASTNFFISYLRKGTYVFEYPIRVTHKGSFSNGITSIQCMYAPEFTSHSEGIRVKVQ